MSHPNHENGTILWEDKLWGDFPNDNYDNSGGGKTTPAPETKVEIGKKRGRGAPRKGKGGIVLTKEDGETPDHELHIWTERERRKKMRNMFQNLHSLLPQLPPKADKSTIVDEAVNAIKTLQATLQRLQKQKLERLQGGTQPKSLSLEPSIGATSTIAMLSTRETFMADQVTSNNNNNNNNSTIAKTNMAMSSHHLPVAIQTWTSSNVVLNICGNDAQFVVYAPKKSGIFTTICCVLEKHKLEVVTAHISSDANRNIYMIQARLANKAAEKLPEVMAVEDIYKQAAGEMMMWVTS